MVLRGRKFFFLYHKPLIRCTYDMYIGWNVYFIYLCMWQNNFKNTLYVAEVFVWLAEWYGSLSLIIQIRVNIPSRKYKPNKNFPLPLLFSSSPTPPPPHNPSSPSSIPRIPLNPSFSPHLLSDTPNPSKSCLRSQTKYIDLKFRRTRNKLT